MSVFNKIRSVILLGHKWLSLFFIVCRGSISLLIGPSEVLSLSFEVLLLHIQSFYLLCLIRKRFVKYVHCLREDY